MIYLGIEKTKRKMTMEKKLKGKNFKKKNRKQNR
jgi:hypothetical protein